MIRAKKKNKTIIIKVSRHLSYLIWRISEYNGTLRFDWHRSRRFRSHRNTNTDFGMRGDGDTIVPGTVAHPWRQVSPSAWHATSNSQLSAEWRCFFFFKFRRVCPAGWCGKSTKTTTPTVAMTTTDSVARIAVTRSRVRASCRAPKRYFSFVFSSSTIIIYAPRARLEQWRYFCW